MHTFFTLSSKLKLVLRDSFWLEGLSVAKLTLAFDYPVLAASGLSLDSANLLESLNIGL